MLVHLVLVHVHLVHVQLVHVHLLLVQRLLVHHIFKIQFHTYMNTCICKIKWTNICSPAYSPYPIVYLVYGHLVWQIRSGLIRTQVILWDARDISLSLLGPPWTDSWVFPRTCKTNKQVRHSLNLYLPWQILAVKMELLLQQFLLKHITFNKQSVFLTGTP